MRKYIDVLSEHQKEYLDKYASLKIYLETRLPEISSLDDLESLRKRIKKEQHALESMYGEMIKIQKTLKESTSKQSTKVKQTFEHWNQKFIDRFNKATPDCKTLFDQIDAKKQEIKDDNDPAKILKKLISKFQANELDIQAFNDFLMNPAVKSKMRANPLFSAKVEHLNRQIIVRYGHTLARLDQELFLNIRLQELFSPWAFAKSPTIKANAANYNNLSDYITNLILAAPSIEERSIIVDRWIWVAQYLFEELKDYSGCHAILSALSRNEVSRLSRTFESLSPETQDTFDKLSKSILVSSSLRPIFNAQEAVIPAMPLIQRDVTFVADGNKSVEDLESKDDKREEMMMRTGGGKKIVLAFDKLQTERTKYVIPNNIDLELDDFLRDRLKNPAVPYDSDAADQRSTELEPPKNDLKAAKPVRFGKVFKSASHNNQSCMRQVILEDLIKGLTTFVVNDPSGFLRGRNQEGFQMDEKKYVIDWEKEAEQIAMLHREIEANVDALKGYSTNEKNSSLVSRTQDLINKLEALDFKQIKMQQLENKLNITLFKLKVEFSSLSRVNHDNENVERLDEIIAEVEKISTLAEECQFSSKFQKNLEEFNKVIDAYKLSSNSSEVKQEDPQVELEKPGLSVSHLRCRYSLLYAPLRHDHSVHNDLIPGVQPTAITCA
ncbi:RasGEF domain-containing protein [Legionella maceachernii]|nr:RasGEF domain-containing protein [Legionella maceachernii]